MIAHGGSSISLLVHYISLLESNLKTVTFFGSAEDFNRSAIPTSPVTRLADMIFLLGLCILGKTHISPSTTPKKDYTKDTLMRLDGDI